MDAITGSIITFLLEEVKSARARALPAHAEFAMAHLLMRRARFSRRLHRLAYALEDVAAQTPDDSSGQKQPT